MECHDRIAVQMTDLVLGPVRLLGELSLLSAVTVRALRGGRRFHITVGKEWPLGMRGEPTFWWRLREIDATGIELADGVLADSHRLTLPTFGAPEDAYWAAVETLATTVDAAAHA